MSTTTPTTPQAAAGAPLREVQRREVDRALRVLIGAHCRFCIIEPDGTKHGELVVAEPVVEKPKSGRGARGPLRYPRGTMLAYVQPMLDEIPANDCTVVPYGRFDSPLDQRTLQSTICTYAGARWGNDTYTTHRTAAGIEVFRFS